MFRELGRRLKGSRKWRDYEEVARYVLLEMKDNWGFREVEGKMIVPGLRSGTRWEIDARATTSLGDKFLLVECRRSKRGVSQEAMGAIAYRIRDIGASGGILVSPQSPQRGARIIAAAEGVKHMALREDSTVQEWFAKIDDVIHVGFSVATTPKASLGVVVTRAHDGSTESHKA